MSGIEHLLIPDVKNSCDILWGMRLGDLSFIEYCEDGECCW